MKSLGQDPSKAELEKMIMLSDADGSGDIDFAEFVTLVAHKMKDDDESLQERKLVDAFKVFDADGNGVIDKYEMRKIMYNLGEDMSVRVIGQLSSTGGEKRRSQAASGGAAFSIRRRSSQREGVFVKTTKSETSSG